MLNRTIIFAGTATSLFAAVALSEPAQAAGSDPVDNFMISCTFDGEIMQSANYIACCEKKPKGVERKCVVCKKGTPNCYIRYHTATKNSLPKSSKKRPPSQGLMR